MQSIAQVGLFGRCATGVRLIVSAVLSLQTGHGLGMKSMDVIFHSLAFFWFSAAFCRRCTAHYMIRADVGLIAKTIELHGFKAILTGCLPLR